MSAPVLKLAEAPEPDAEVIQCLREALEAAMRGEIASISYAAVLRDGSMRTALTPPYQHAFSMFGALERLKLRFYTLHIEEPPQ